MLIASLGLALLAVVLAWPVPVALAKARWPRRSPGLALLLWLAIALSGGLSMIGSLLAFGLMPFGDDLATGLGVLASHLFAGPLPADVGVAHILALSGALLLGVHLLLNLGVTAARAERERRRHHALVMLLSTPTRAYAGARVLDHAAPVAYCLPGVRTTTVLSEGLIELLEPSQLDAVLAHERTHLRQFHHIVLLAFHAWNAALPWFPIANRAEGAVSALVEMLADDEALDVVSPATLADTIALVGSHWESAASAGAAGRVDIGNDVTRARIERLQTADAGLTPPARTAVVVASALLVLVPVWVLVQLLS